MSIHQVWPYLPLLEALIGYSPEVNGPILSHLFEVGENHKNWHKDAVKGELILLGATWKVMLELFAGWGVFLFICLLVKMKMSSL